MWAKKSKNEKNAADADLSLPNLAANIIRLLEVHNQLTDTEIQSMTGADAKIIKKCIKKMLDLDLLQKMRLDKKRTVYQFQHPGGVQYW